ncbi:1053_t:CDS:2, partial [Paraglomus occultum]
MSISGCPAIDELINTLHFRWFRFSAFKDKTSVGSTNFYATYQPTEIPTADRFVGTQVVLKMVEANGGSLYEEIEDVIKSMREDNDSEWDVIYSKSTSLLPHTKKTIMCSSTLHPLKEFSHVFIGGDSGQYYLEINNETAF